MIVLWLLAAHLVGDFVLQTRWQAANKLDDSNFRNRHVLAYSLPFIPIAYVYGDYGKTWMPCPGPGFWFMFCLFVLHYATDSRRFHSTLGDWIAWHFKRNAWHFSIEKLDGTVLDDVSSKLSPNPWTPIPIIIDQTLHVCQLALLATLFLR